MSDHPSPATRGRLDCAGIRKRFGAVEVLRGIELSAIAGEFLTLLGPSGCGKTTLLRIVAGLELADGGTVALDGADLSRLPANRRPVNTVFQSYALFPHLDVRDNIAFGLRARRFAADEIRRRVDDAATMLRLTELMTRRPHQLSGGQKQRVALARALVNQPAVLLLDEPLSALDAQLRMEVRLELRRLQRRLGTTFILVTHDQDEAMTVSDRIAVMNGGVIEQLGTPREVYEHPVSRFVAGFLGAANLIAATRSPIGVECVYGPLRLRTPPPWKSGTLAIRPEHIVIRPEVPSANRVRTRVIELIYRGDHVEVGCGDLRARVPPAQAPAVGEEVWLELPAEHLEMLRD